MTTNRFSVVRWCTLMLVLSNTSVPIASASVVRLRRDLRTELQRYDARRTRAKRDLLAEFASTIRKAGGDRQYDERTRSLVVARLERERDAFTQSGRLPESDRMFWPTLAYVDSLRSGAPRVRKAYQRLEDRLRESGTEDGLDQLVRDKQRFDDALPGSGMLSARTKWSGARHFTNANVNVNLWVGSIEGAAFEGTLRMNQGRTVMTVKGLVDGHRVMIQPTEIVQGRPRALRFQGYVLDGRMVLSTSGINVNRKPASDCFVLRRR